MKKHFLLLFIFSSFFASIASACDICGGGVSNYNPYLFPHLNRAYLGISYTHRNYQTLNANKSWNHEQYGAFLLSGQFSPAYRVQLAAIIPYQFNTLTNDDGSQALNGFGDATFLVNYNIWEREIKKNTHSLTIGGGLKFPSGKYRSVSQMETEEQNFQLGTGSIDYILQGTYRTSFRKWVLSATGSYKYNNQNRDGYRFGDVLTTGLTAVYKKELTNFSLLPYIIVLNEYYYNDADHHVLQSRSGGNVFSTGGGLDLSTEKISVGANFQVSPVQSLAEGDIKAKQRLALRVSFVL